MSSGRRVIGPGATVRLWVTAGGRCEVCNRYLLEDEVTGEAFNLAERAHIVGATTAPRSPRGDDPLPVIEREDPDNLMLLCREHHRMIDSLVTEHSVEGLRRMKRRHENRIRLLTGFTDEAETLVVRVVGAIRGAPVELAPASVLPAVRADGRFPRYRLALAGEDVEIDLRHLPDEGAADYWSSGEKLIADRLGRLQHPQNPIHHVSLFAIARVPFLVAVGFHLDDKIPTAIYARRRDGTGDKGWGYDPEAEAVSFELRRLGEPQGDTVALAISLTAPISDDVRQAMGEDATIYEILPKSSPFGRDLFAARASLDVFAETYHGFLALLEEVHPSCEELQMFVAAPVPAAVALGRGVMRDSQPSLMIYDRDHEGHFQPVLKLER